MPAPKIITRYERKPGPLRVFDWEAQYEGDGEGDPCGFGRTEKEAIERLTKHFPREETP